MVAEIFADGVWFVELAPIRDPALVVPTIARALGVGEDGGEPLAARLASTLRDRRLLLVLDNFEHLVAAAPLVADLLAACPRLTVLVTSRAPRCASPASASARRPPLDLADRQPRRQTVATSAAAVRLFVARAQAAQPDFALTADERGGGRDDLPAPRRPAAGDRAGRRADQGFCRRPPCWPAWSGGCRC